MSLDATIELAIVAAIAYLVLAALTWAGVIGQNRTHPGIDLAPLPPAPTRHDQLYHPKKFQRDADAFLVGIINLAKQLEELERQYHEQERRKEDTRRP